MVNSRGDEVFDPVADKLIELGVDPIVRREVCSVLIDALQQVGWDTEYESMQRYMNDLAIVAAFVEHGVLPEGADNLPGVAEAAEPTEDALRARKQELLNELSSIDEKLAGDWFDDPGDAP